MKSNPNNQDDSGGAVIPSRLLKLENALSPAPPLNDQFMVPMTVANDNRTMAIIMAFVVIVFFISGVIYMYGRQCGGDQRRFRGRFNLTLPMGLPGSGSGALGRGLSSEIIQSFPIFVYSTVKGRRSGEQPLACAVCLNDYNDDETLRLIPKCSHVFHPECIDGWLKSHYTCPLCRANLLIPVAAQGEIEREESPLVAVDIAEDSGEGEGEEEEGNDNCYVGMSCRRMNRRSRTVREERGPLNRSKSTGFVMGVLFGRSRSTGLFGHGREDWERYTLKWEEEVKKERRRLKRTKSCVTFSRMTSSRRGYRTGSVGSSVSNHSNLHLAYDRFVNSNTTFTFNSPTTTPPFLHHL